MSKKKSDIKADIDYHENPSLMEPMLISESSKHWDELMNLSVELAQKSAAFKSSLPSAMQLSLAGMVRAMNCYYSNLIEGHDTHPIAIERALQGDYSADTKKRNLQLEATAHVAVQEWLDAGNLKSRVFLTESLCEIHNRFYKMLPKELLWVENPETKEKLEVIPGKLRETNVEVGNHIAISAGAVPRFLTRFESVYQQLGKASAILSLASSHHRFLWIHPFLDGNGRVARLMSHAAVLDVLDNGGLWSISRGLARRSVEYKELLSNCDLLRRNDLDGRGHLSQEALVEFTRFFLETCLDQVAFMQKLMQPEHLRTRILLWAKEEVQMGSLPPQSTTILEAILYRGEVLRGDLAVLLNLSDRHTRRIIAPLFEKKVLISEGAKSPIHLGFPADLAHRFMPGLFPAL